MPGKLIHAAARRSTLCRVSTAGSELTGRQLGHYLVGPVLGRGGMSVVYRATDQRLGRPVALKVINDQLSSDPEFRGRFVEEARAASAIDHPNIVPLSDVGAAGPVLFIAMRLVDGIDLAELIRSGPPAPRRALALLNQVASALDALHAHGLVHLDVKPSNVLVARTESTGTEVAYLADFGLTRRGPGGQLTASGDFLGSPSSASPAHLRGQPVGPASDEYSLACMMFCALAGNPPYTGSVSDVITAHFRGELPSLAAAADLSPTMDRVLARAMAPGPTMRYPSCGDLIGAARRALAEG
jgi:serine/threonine-protein kinase